MELAENLGVGQTTAWFFRQRIRRVMDGRDGLLSGIADAAETYLGGKKLTKGPKGQRASATMTMTSRQGGSVRARIWSQSPPSAVGAPAPPRAAPRHLRRAQKQLRRAQRIQSRRKKGSARRRVQARRVGVIHRKVVITGKTRCIKYRTARQPKAMCSRSRR